MIKEGVLGSGLWAKGRRAAEFKVLPGDLL